MSKSTKILLIVSIIVFIISAAISAFIKIQSKQTSDIKNQIENNPENQSDEINEPEVFSFTDSNGEEFQINEESDLGKAIIFWDSDSKNSLETLDLIDIHYEKYKDSVDFYIINTNEKLENIIEVIESCNYSFPVYYDTNNKASEFYTLDELPTLIFIDKQDEQNIISDGIDEDTLTANLDLLAENY